MNSTELKAKIFDIQVELEKLQFQKEQSLNLLSQIVAQEKSEKAKSLKDKKDAKKD